MQSGGYIATLLRTGTSSEGNLNLSEIRTFACISSWVNQRSVHSDTVGFPTITWKLAAPKTLEIPSVKYSQSVFSVDSVTRSEFDRSSSYARIIARIGASVHRCIVASV